MLSSSLCHPSFHRGSSSFLNLSTPFQFPCHFLLLSRTAILTRLVIGYTSPGHSYGPQGPGKFIVILFSASTTTLITSLSYSELLLQSNQHIYGHVHVKHPSCPLERQDGDHGSPICLAPSAPAERSYSINMCGVTFHEV